MTQQYIGFDTGDHMSVGVLQAAVSSQIAAGANATVRARNQTGKAIRVTGAAGWASTANNQAGTTLDITDTTPTTFLSAAINMQAGGQINVAAGVNAANLTLANNGEALFVFTNAAGGAATAMTDPQGTLWYRVDFNAGGPDASMGGQSTVRLRADLGEALATANTATVVVQNQCGSAFIPILATGYVGSIGAGAATLDVQVGGASIMTSTITLAANSAVAGTVTNGTAIADTTDISFIFNNQSGGNITECQAVLTGLVAHL